jgi:1-deoxy-D-xylulose-5-phosphate reductoisomerase
MRLPIRYALGYPERLASTRQKLKLSDYSMLTFEEPDRRKFPLLTYAFDAIEKGGNMPCILNAANEIAVDAFLNGKIRFTEMPRLVRKVMDSITFMQAPTLENLVTANTEARAYAASLL